MGVIISYAVIQNLIAKIEDTPPDLTPEIRVGDWVLLDGQNRADFAQSGIVLDGADGYLILGLGSHELDDRLRQRSRPVHYSHVREIWRQVDVVNRDSFEHKGKQVAVTVIEYEWKQISVVVPEANDGE